MAILRLMLIALGIFCLALGTIGAFVPVLPTVPLYLLATLLFARSSQRLHTWFTHTAIYKKHLDSYVRGQGMPLATKRRITLMISVSMVLGIYLTASWPWVQAVLGIIWLGLMIYFYGIVKTRTME